MKKRGHEVWYWTQTGNELIDWVNVSRLLDWCDVAFFEWAQTPFLQALSMENPRCKVVLRAHGLPFFSIYRTFPWNRVDLVICAGYIIMSKLEELPPDRRPPSYIHIPEGSDPTFFNIPRSKKYGHKIAFHSTVIRFKKRVYTTIQSFYDLLQRDDRWKLCIAGNWDQPSGSGWEGANYTEPCMELIEDLGIRSDVELTPNLPRDQWRNWLADKDVFVSNSIREGVQVSLVDAMLCGVYPLINCWRGSDAYYPKENVFRTQRELVDMILVWSEKSVKEKRALSQKMRHWAVENFDVSLMAERLVEELEFLCA